MKKPPSHMLTDDELIDEVGEESFPASDPPPWTTGTDRGASRARANTSARGRVTDRARAVWRFLRARFHRTDRVHPSS